MDECATGAASCHANSHCVNQPGGYRCVCDVGYTTVGRICMGESGKSFTGMCPLYILVVTVGVV